MDAEKKRLRDEVAELSDAVRSLRDELIQERLARAAHACRCHCAHPVWVYPQVCYPITTYTSPPYTITTYGSSTATIRGAVTTNYALPAAS